MKPSNFWIFKIFEPGLEKSISNTPCADRGYTDYKGTPTHGVPPITMTLDMYHLPSSQIIADEEADEEAIKEFEMDFDEIVEEATDEMIDFSPGDDVEGKHGTCVDAVQKDLRFACDFNLSDYICCYNSIYAENEGYAFTPEHDSWIAEMRKSNANGEPYTFYDSVTG